MTSIEMLTTFLGWCLVINLCAILALLLLGSVFKNVVAKLQSKIFGVTEAEAKVIFFQIFHQFRLVVFVFNVVPFIALLIMKGQ